MNSNNNENSSSYSNGYKNDDNVEIVVIIK